MDSRRHSPREAGVTTRGGETIALPSELRAPGGMVDPAGLEPATDGGPPAFVTKQDRPGGRRMPGRPPPKRRLRATAGFHVVPAAFPPASAVPHQPAAGPATKVGREGPAPWGSCWSVRVDSPRHSPGRRPAGSGTIPGPWRRGCARAGFRHCGRRRVSTRRAHLWRMDSRTAFAMGPTGRTRGGRDNAAEAAPRVRPVARPTFKVMMESRPHSSRPGPGARFPGRPAPIRQSTIRSISSIQRSVPVPSAAKAAIASNTASEKPPTLRMSARSCACVVA